MNGKARNGWIDLLRGLGAVAVVLFHFNRMPVTVPADTLSRVWRSVWSHGHWGVGVFFVLSGYCLFPGWTRARTGWNFLLRRARRIFPPYWCSLLLVVGLAASFKLINGVNDVARLPASPAAILATIFLLTDPVTAVPTVNWVYWTLSYVFAFYLLAGLILFGPPGRRLAILAGLHLAMIGVDFIFHSAPYGPLFFVRYWPVFGLGLALAVFFADRRTGTVMLAGSLLHGLWLVGTGRDETHYLLVGAGTVAFLALSRTWTFPGWLQPAAWIGRISYGLYLVHVPVGINGLWRMLPEEFHHSSGFVGAQILLLTVTVAAAWLFYRIAEHPFVTSSSPETAIPRPA
jgi:peptidoglycan/LPS O-acetylase OafA/YrhL